MNINNGIGICKSNGVNLFVNVVARRSFCFLDIIRCAIFTVDRKSITSVNAFGCFCNNSGYESWIRIRLISLCGNCTISICEDSKLCIGDFITCLCVYLFNLYVTERYILHRNVSCVVSFNTYCLSIGKYVAACNIRLNFLYGIVTYEQVINFDTSVCIGFIGFGCNRCAV